MDLKSTLSEIVGPKYVKDSIPDLYSYSSDASVHQQLPDAIVQPGCAREVQDLVRFANEELIPIVPRGGGSGMSGHTVPIDGGIVIDMKRMDHVIEVDPQDMYARVEPGVVDDDLNRMLKPCNMFYPPSPASSNIATIGGEIGTNASGIRAVKYGATRDYVLGMILVLPTGEIVELGAKSRVESSGYQVYRLIVGSEGTLGIVVEATLKFIPLPKYRCLGMATFDKLSDAGDTIGDIIASGSEPSMLELMDDVAIKAVNRAMDMGLPDVEAIILFEADGKVKEAIDYEINSMKNICENNKGKVQSVSYDAEERTKIFSARKKLFPSLSRYKDGYSCTSLADDMAVPYTKMAVLAEKIHEIADKNDIIMTAYGHCGSGVMHTKILMDTSKESQWEAAERAVSEVYDFVHEVGGVTSGEHGIALSKAPFLKKERKGFLSTMRKIKNALDPNNILNPHKLMDAPDNWRTATPLRYRVKS